jgi:hypothetical protein
MQRRRRKSTMAAGSSSLGSGDARCRQGRLGVRGVPGCGAAYKRPGGHLGMRATHGKAGTSRTRGGGAALPSPGWRRCGGRDDMRASPVSDSGCGGGERLRPWAGWAASSSGLVRSCLRGLACAAAGLGRAGWAVGASGGLLRCWAAAWLERAAWLAAGLDGGRGRGLGIGFGNF